MSDYKLLDNINDIDDDLLCEAETWEPRKAKKPMRLKVALIATAAAVLCGATAVTAVANLRPPKDIIVNDEPLAVDYTVYTDEKGREIRTYAFELPDYALVEEKEGRTPVGQVRFVEASEGDGEFLGDWVIVDEEGTVFTYGINNKEIRGEIKDPANPHTQYDVVFTCANFLWNEYDIYTFNEDLDGDSATDSIYVYVYRYDDKETVRKLCEKHGDYFNEEIFDRNVEWHDKIYSNSDEE